MSKDQVHPIVTTDLPSVDDAPDFEGIIASILEGTEQADEDAVLVGGKKKSRYQGVEVDMAACVNRRLCRADGTASRICSTYSVDQKRGWGFGDCRFCGSPTVVQRVTFFGTHQAPERAA